ncbi:MAG: hypothetical protein QOJ60_3247, partial [Actinomycetota bacterium]|nr:hypothetical protein [Actinomycetota bacterium]
MSNAGRRNPRNVELALLVPALVVELAAFAEVGLALDGALPAGFVGYGAGLGVLFGLALLALRRLAP